jgi:hypothetical protein
VIEKSLENKIKDASIDMILLGTFEKDDIAILRELGSASKNKQQRINFMVDKLIYH